MSIDLLIVLLLGLLCVLIIIAGFQRAERDDREQDEDDGLLDDEPPWPDLSARARELAFQPTFFTESDQEEIRELLEELALERDAFKSNHEGTKDTKQV